VEQGVPRSGGDLNYLQYVYSRPAYRKNTVLFSACFFGISFIILGNMAGNAISFATSVLEAANIVPTEGTVRGIAIAISVFACFIHTFSRRGGIVLNNILAGAKLCIILIIIIVTIIYSKGGFGNYSDKVIQENLGANSLRNRSSNPHGYARSFLSIVFAFGGFEQPNYVLGEIKRPHRIYPVSMFVSVSCICLLYLIVNICYVSNSLTFTNSSVNIRN